MLSIDIWPQPDHTRESWNVRCSTLGSICTPCQSAIDFRPPEDGGGITPGYCWTRPSHQQAVSPEGSCVSSRSILPAAGEKRCRHQSSKGDLGQEPRALLHSPKVVFSYNRAKFIFQVHNLDRFRLLCTYHKASFK